MRQHRRSALLGALLCLAAAQLIRPSLANPPAPYGQSLWSDPRVEPRVAGVLRRACANCHSNETDWPWYAKISPVSWLLARDVSKGRAKLNFSEWSGATANQVQEIADAIDKDEMPPASYRLMHPEARLSPADQDILRNWADSKLVQAR